MIKHVIKMADGTLLRAGEEAPSILSVRLIRSTNSGTQLQPGSVCAAMAEIAIFGNSHMIQGDYFTLFEEQEDGKMVGLGRFFAEEPKNTGANTWTVTAYDTVTLLDKDLSQWVESLDQWPYTMEELAGMVCRECGAVFGSSQIPNGDHPVQKFQVQGVTGRQIMQWIAQAACCYCVADGQGVLQLGWYAGTGKPYTPSDCCQGGLQMADYITTAIQRVRISAKENDVGTVWPEVAGQANTYTVLGNPLLVAESASQLKSVAQVIYSRLKNITYIPCTVQVPLGKGPAPGEVVSVTDKNGRTGNVYVMEIRREGNRETFTCSGAASVDSTTAVNQQSVGSLSGKMLRLRMDVDGLLVENADMAGNFAKLELAVDGMKSTVQKQTQENGKLQQDLTEITQSSKEITATVQSIVDNGVDKVTTSFGLTIDGSAVRIHRSGSEMENKLDETGMYVHRGDDIMLQANANGVIATDVSVRNYLMMGDHARFEDYGSDRTACFYV